MSRLAAAALLALLPAAGSLDTAETLPAARLRAASEGRDVLLLFVHASSPESQELRRSLLTDRKVADLRDLLILVILDPYDRAEGTALARRFNIHRIPAMILVDARDEEVERLEDAPAARDLKRHLDEMRSRKGPLARLRSREKERPSDPEAIMALARELRMRGDLGGARTRLGQVSQPAARVAPAVAARALHDLALVALLQEDAARAREAFEAAIARAPESAAAQDAELGLAQIAALEGRTGDATAALEAFRKAHPEHPRDAEARALLDRLRAGS